ncbi:MAG TPA: hypothetical protein VN848_13395 [Gemmatimonadales bacterium]|nr:hypothetical protein [Gemmatimonadales bacterium]
MHAVIRRYRVRLGTMDEAVRYVDKWFLPLMRRIPGFVAFQLMGEAERVLTAWGLFETAVGAETASGLARDWFGKEWGSFRVLPPEAIGGEVLASATRSRPTTERRRVADRRSRPADGRPADERRTGVERRGLAAEPVFAELRAAG